MKKWIVLLLVLAAGGGGSWWWFNQNEETNGVTFRTATVERGELVYSINATGTLQPEEVIDVGAQVAGRIISFGTDPNNPKKPIDYGTQVDEGTILANIDDSLFETRLASATAQHNRALADYDQLRAKRDQAQLEWKRARELHDRIPPSISDTEYDLAKANAASADATVRIGQAAIDESNSSLKEAKINLGYTVIRSPVKGIIIDRRVNIGQTVVASLNAPSLFLLAKDLTRMQVWASVNEADIGGVKVGQRVRFTVDAHRGTTFWGETAQIRLNANMTQNVVNYIVVVNVDNSSGKLLPYLTANLQFEVDRVKDALLVPNAALRWKPRTELIAPEFREEYASANTRQRPEGGGGMGGGEGAKRGKRDTSIVWVEASGFLKPVPVKIGISDGSRTQILDGLTEGDKVIMGETRKDEQSVNPFTPQMFRRPPGQQ